MIAQTPSLAREPDRRIGELEARARHLNGRLAEAFGTDGAVAGQAALEDRLFAYGVLGGKDVGKSTLINALAGQDIVASSAVFAEGTRTAVVYVHGEDLAGWNARITEHGFTRPLRLCPHDRDVLRNVVLVDLPDFDSRFEDHASYVHDFQRLLDGCVWITTSQKYRDRALQDELRRVHRDDFWFVLNKADWVVEARREASAEELREKFSAAIEEALGGGPIDASRVFVVSATDRSYDFPRLAEILVREHSPLEIERRKRLNRLNELSAFLRRIDATFRLREGAADLEGLLDGLPAVVESAFGEAVRESALAELATLAGPHRRQSAALLYHRLEGWPFLRAALWPLRLLVGYVGGRIAHRTGRDDDYDALAQILDTGEQPLAARLEAIRERLELDHRAALDWIERTGGVGPPPGGGPESADRLVARLRAGLERHDRERTAALQQRRGRPGVVSRMLVYLVPLWFVLIQPVGAVVLKVLRESEPNGSALPGVLEIAHQAVSLLSASVLLQALVIVLVCYAIWLVKIYADCARWVALDRAESLDEFWRDHLTREVTEIWRTHYAAHARRMSACRDEWDLLRTETESERSSVAGQGASV